jgi:hypothetical protein
MPNQAGAVDRLFERDGGAERILFGGSLNQRDLPARQPHVPQIQRFELAGLDRPPAGEWRPGLSLAVLARHPQVARTLRRVHTADHRLAARRAEHIDRDARVGQRGAVRRRDDRVSALKKAARGRTSEATVERLHRGLVGQRVVR